MNCLTKVVLASTFAMLAGCSTTETESHWSKTLRETSFLPSPGLPGERSLLSSGERLIVLKRGWGYSRVKNSAGKMGDVPTEDLGPSDGPAPSEWPSSPSPNSRTSSVKFDAEIAPLSGNGDSQPAKEDQAVAPGLLPPVEPDLPAWDDTM
jgi:hypothetical protein